MNTAGHILPHRWNEGEKQRAVSILRFQIPLGITAVLMATSFSIINAALTRTAAPETALAAFALGYTVTNMFASPVWVARQMLVAFSTDRGSMRAAIRTTVVLAAAVLAWLMVLAFTPVGYLVFVTLAGAGESLFPYILSVVRICLALPLVHLARAWSQSILISRKRTTLMTWAMVCRIPVMLVLAVYLPGSGLVEGAVVGAAIWVAGMAVESLLCVGFALPLRGQIPSSNPAGDSSVSTERDCARFLWPLVVQALLLTFSLPVVNAGLARTLQPERNLAIFQVAWSLAFLFIAFIHMNLSQAVLVLLDDRKWWLSLRRVGLWLAALDSAALALLVLSGLGDWILLNIIGVEASMLPTVRRVLLLMSPAPFIGGYLELKMGVALRFRKTLLIGIGKGIDLTVMMLVIFALSMVLPDLGAHAGPIAFTLGLVANYLFMQRTVPEPFTEVAVSSATDG